MQGALFECFSPGASERERKPSLGQPENSLPNATANESPTLSLSLSTRPILRQPPLASFPPFSPCPRHSQPRRNRASAFLQFSPAAELDLGPRRRRKMYVRLPPRAAAQGQERARLLPSPSSSASRCGAELAEKRETRENAREEGSARTDRAAAAPFTWPPAAAAQSLNTVEKFHGCVNADRLCC